MKKLYLDYNVISYLRSGKIPMLTNIFEGSSKEQIVVFSPAHLEDIAASAKRDKIDSTIIDAEIDFLAKIAGRNALRPINYNDLVEYDETPQDCYKRVVDNYDANELAEALEALVLADANQNPMGNPREMNNIAPENVLQNISYRELIALCLVSQRIIDKSESADVLSWQFKDIRNRFRVFEAYVNLAANLLEKIGYYREQQDKARSRLHDVSHIIYGAYCDTFVSADKKLIKKAKAIYELLDIHTLVLTDKEFCGLA